MREFVKKLISAILVFSISTSPILAKNKTNNVSEITHKFAISELPDNVILKTKEEIKIGDELSIPPDSIVTLKVMEAQKERRWHKSGFIICKLIKYQTDVDLCDVSDKDIYLVARKYEALDKKDAAILTTEIILTQAASIVGSCFIIFAPVDIAYFFTKGAIKRDRNPNWFKSGVSCAYDNSICWFWLKGKPIDMEENQTVKVKQIKEKKALKLTKKIGKKKLKASVKESKKLLKKEIKITKKYTKEQAKLEKKKLKADKQTL